MVAGARPEPLLGDHDAKDLGVISFQPEGGDPHHDRREKDEKNVSNPARHRKAGKEEIIEGPPLHRITDRGREEARQRVDRYRGPVFTDKDWEMKGALVEQKYEAGFKAVRFVSKMAFKKMDFPLHFQNVI